MGIKLNTSRVRSYYDEIHPFLPLLPMRSARNAVLPTLLPESPFHLAVQTILVLVPHPHDPKPKSCSSKRARGAASNALAQQTLALIERSLAQPSIEIVQALCMLALWEWSHSGSLERNRELSGQAIQIAMDLGIHEMDKYQTGGRAMEGDDWQRDMARRTWWVVYVGQLTSAFVSGTSPLLSADDTCQVLFPVCSIDDETWPNWVNTVRQCSRVFEIINTVYFSDTTEAHPWGRRMDGVSSPEKTQMRLQMLEVDVHIVELMKQAEASAIIELVPGGEEEVVRNQQMAARLGLATTHIHIHRQQAFPEVSLFSKHICGLPKAPDLSSSLPMLDSVSVPQALANGHVPVYSESPNYQSMNSNLGISDHGSGYETIGGNEIDPFELDFLDELWQPDTYPENLPAPWFSRSGGAASLYAPIESTPKHFPFVPASISPIISNDGDDRASSVALSAKPHKAWGVDSNDKPSPNASPGDQIAIFPPGISLARCATAAHTIVRLEVLHRSASIAMTNGP